MWRSFGVLRFSGRYARAARVAWLAVLPACAPAPRDPGAGSSADVAPSTRPVESSAPLPPSPADGGNAAQDAADAGTSQPSGSGACSPPPPGLADKCGALLMAYAAGTPVSCDSGFHARRAGHVHCRPGDLLCAIRMSGWDHAPIYQAAPPEQIAACLSECRAGNGASCVRVAKVLTTSP